MGYSGGGEVRKGKVFQISGFHRIKRALFAVRLVVNTRNLLDGPRMKAWALEYLGVGRA